MISLVLPIINLLFIWMMVVGSSFKHSVDVFGMIFRADTENCSQTSFQLDELKVKWFFCVNWNKENFAWCGKAICKNDVYLLLKLKVPKFYLFTVVYVYVYLIFNFQYVTEVLRKIFLQKL